MIRFDNPLSCTVPTLAEGPGASKDTRQRQEHAWRREMERAQLAAWLSHGVVGGGKSAPVPAAHLLAPTSSTGDAIGAEGGGFANRRAVSPLPSAALGAADTSHSARASVSAQTNGAGGSPAARENSRQGAAAAGDVLFTPSRLTPDRMAAAKPAVSAGSPAAVEVGAAALGPEIQMNLFAPFALHGGEPAGVPRAGRQEQIALAHRVCRPEADGVIRQPVRIHAQWTPEGVHVWLALDAGALAHQDAIAQQVRRWVLAQGARVLSLYCNARLLIGGGERGLPSAESNIDNNVEVKETVWPSVR